MEKNRINLVFVLLLLAACSRQFYTDAAPAGPLIKHIRSLVKWSGRSSLKAMQSDMNVLQFEDGYLTETVVEGNGMGMIPYKIRVSADGELYAVDEINSNIVKITPPLSQYSRSRLVAGSFQGHVGHVDGKPSEARFNHPRGVTMDDKGNVYVADTLNLAIRKIGDNGVTTIAGGKSSVAGYRDGPSEDAQFSSDFDVIYVPSTCSLLVIDRGNAALRQISLTKEDCGHQDQSISWSVDVLAVFGAIVAGYVLCVVQLGFASSPNVNTMRSDFQEQLSKQTPNDISEIQKEEPKWSSPAQLVSDFSKLFVEGISSLLTYFTPSWHRQSEPKMGLTPLKDSLRMPEDDEVPATIKKQTFSPSFFRQEEALAPHKDPPRSPEDDDNDRIKIKKQTASHLVYRSHGPEDNDDGKEASIPSKWNEMKPPKGRSMKEGSISGKHRFSKRPEYAEFYGSGEMSANGRSKGKEKSRHRHKSGEIIYSSGKSAETKHGNANEMKVEHLRVRSKYEPENSYRFS